MEAPNTLFPGRPNYTGPTEGWFGFIHHAIPFEYSHDIMERVNFIKQHKPENEVPVRLNHLISLSALSLFLDSLQLKRDALYQKYQSKQDDLNQERQSRRNALYQEYAFREDTLYQEYLSEWAALDQEFQRTILNYIKQHIPNCAWDGNQLQFSSGLLKSRPRC